MPPSKLHKVLKTKTKGITLFVFTADVIVLIIVLIILWVMPEPRTPGENCGYMCLQCTTDPSGTCCGCRDVILQNYMEKTFDEKHNEISAEYSAMFERTVVKIHKGYIGDVKPVAHLIGEDRDMPATDEISKNILPIRKWYRGNNCLLLNGVTLNNGRVRVPVSGYYHVYSAIDFNYQFIRNTTQNTINVLSKSPCLIHSIYKSNIKEKKSGEKEVMCTHHPYERSENSIFSRYDTYISADIHLEAGEEIYVKVANISYASSPPKNVFGIHLI